MRRVSVIVDADEKPFTAALGRAAGQALALQKILHGIRDENVTIDVRVAGDRDLKRVQGEVNELTGRKRIVDVDAGRARAEIDDLSGRLRVGLDLFAMFGPAVSPIGALAVPALAGLATQATIAGAAGLTAVLAFQDMGDALTAIEKARLEPTVANLQAAEQALDQLSPAAAAFATHLSEVRGEIRGATVDAAAEGLFPGLDRGLDDLETALPRAEEFFRTIGDITGDLAADNAESLVSGRWTEFVDYIQAEGRPVLTDLNAAIGDVAHGLGELLIAGEPFSRGFTTGLRDSADDFDQWAAAVKQTEGYRDFVDYVADTGPEVAETASAISGALLDIAVAAAPLGGPALNGLEAIADIFSAIADSPLGTPLLAAAAGAATLNRAMAVSSRLDKGGLFATTRGNVDRLRTGVAGLAGTFGDLRLAQAGAHREGVGQRRDMEAAAVRAEEARRRIGGYASAAGKAAAGVAALTIASSGAGDSLGLQNTAVLGLAGSMLGPWGAAMGAGAGLLMDSTAAGDDLEDSIRRVDDAFTANTASVTAWRSTFSDNTKALRDDFAQVSGDISGDNGLLGVLKPSSWLESFDVVMNGVDSRVGRAGQTWAAAESDLASFDDALVRLGTSFGVVDDGNASLSEMERIATILGPAMEKLDLDWGDLEGMSRGELDDLAAEASRLQSAADSTGGRLDAFAGSIADLGYEALSTADSAAAMGGALDALLSPTLDAEEATHAWRESLAGLRNELTAGDGFSGATEASRANAAATRDVVRATQDMLVKRAEAGASEREIAGLVQESRREFIRHGIAAGIDADVIRRRANALGLTPKMVRTVFQAAGIGPIERQASQLRATYRGMPKDIRTMIRANNIPQTERGIDRLVRKYELTGRERRALVRLRDLATKDINKVLRGLGVVDSQRPRPTVTLDSLPAGKTIRGLEADLGGLQRRKTKPKVEADTAPGTNAVDQMFQRLSALNGTKAAPDVGADVGQALGGIGAVQNALGGLNSKTIYVTTVTRTRRENALGGFWPAETMAFADGGTRAPGDIPNGHLAELAGPGPTRIWREPETQGEAYLPLANDHRRPRAKTIAEQVVDYFGGQVEWFARGGRRGGDGKGLSDRQKALNSAVRDLNLKPDDGWRSVRRELRDFAKDLKEAHRPWTKALREQQAAIVKTSKRYTEVDRKLERTSRQLDDRLREAADYRRTVASSINGDIFGNGLEGLRIQLEADRNDNQTMLEMLKTAEGNGLDGALAKALYASGDLTTATEFAGLSAAEITEYEQLFNQRTRAQNQLGQFAERDVYAAGTRQLQQLVNRQEKTLSSLDKKIDRMEGAIERGAARGTRAGQGDRNRRAAQDRKKTRR
ncbi:hypothetical protein GCM10009737_08350 [Nocardioides lentus]|uniref:Uncharacterized protein n=1 Tax=Nocardioides lentus TaxID=338077 RepID=A0ABN2P151_9ACTN